VTSVDIAEARERRALRHRQFVHSYVAGPPGVRGNATQAAIAAGYRPATARQQGSRLLTKAYIVAAMKRSVARSLARQNVTADRVISELAAIALHDPREYLTWGPEGVTLKASGELAHAAAVESVGEFTGKHGRDVRIRFHSKVQALEHLAKCLGLMKVDAPPPATTILFVSNVDPRALRNGHPRPLALAAPGVPRKPPRRRGENSIRTPAAGPTGGP
jgi:phage terminase small subunit